MMSPNTMRRIDYWVGIPLCFLLTLVRRVRDVFSRAHVGGAPRNVLFIELAEMGSMVLAMPAVQRLGQRFPGCRVFFLVFKHIDQSVTVLQLAPQAHVLTIDVSTPFTLVRDVARFFVTARRLRLDTTINLETFARFSTVLAWLSGARRRVGFDRFRAEGSYTGALLTHRVPYNPHRHTAESFLTLVESLSAPFAGVPLGKFVVPPAMLPRVKTDSTAAQRLLALLQGAYPAFDWNKTLILVNPNASKLISIRKWPLENYAALVRKLLVHPDVVVAITGVASEKADAQFILETVRSPRVLDLTGKTSLRDLIDLCNVASLLITNDSGPAHFAALTDVHVLVFFGPETPALYAPLTPRCTILYSGLACSPCVSAFNQRVTPCEDNVCLRQITVEQAHAAAMRVLAGRGLRRTELALAWNDAWVTAEAGESAASGE